MLICVGMGCWHVVAGGDESGVGDWSRCNIKSTETIGECTGLVQEDAKGQGGGGRGTL